MFIFYWALIFVCTMGFGVWMGTSNFASVRIDKILSSHLPPLPVPERLEKPLPPEAWDPIRNAAAFGPSADAYRAYAFADYPKALALAYELAKSNDINAQVLLGDMCLRGKGVVQNYERAFAYYQADRKSVV